jgi:hypothetical protein
MGLILSLDPLPELPQAEDARKLSDCEDALTIELPQLLLAHSSEKAQVVLLESLVLAALAEFADLAVVIQDQGRWRGQGGHRHGLLPEALATPSIWVEPNLARSAFLSMPYHACGWMPALYPRQVPPVEFQQELLRLPHGSTFVKEHGDVMKVAQDGRSFYFLQSVKAEKPGLIVEDRVEHQCGTVAEVLSRKSDIRDDLIR